MIKIVIPRWETLQSAGIVSSINGRDLLSIKDYCAYLINRQPEARTYIVAHIHSLPRIIFKHQYEDFRNQYRKSRIRTNSRQNCRIVLEEEDDDDV